MPSWMACSGSWVDVCYRCFEEPNRLLSGYDRREETVDALKRRRLILFAPAAASIADDDWHVTQIPRAACRLLDAPIEVVPRKDQRPDAPHGEIVGQHRPKEHIAERVVVDLGVVRSLQRPDLVNKFAVALTFDGGPVLSGAPIAVLGAVHPGSRIVIAENLVTEPDELDAGCPAGAAEFDRVADGAARSPRALPEALAALRPEAREDAVRLPDRQIRCRQREDFSQVECFPLRMESRDLGNRRVLHFRNHLYPPFIVVRFGALRPRLQALVFHRPAAPPAGVRPGRAP